MKYMFCLFLACFIFAANAHAAGEKAPETVALNQFEQKMVGKVWITVNAVDQKGVDVPAVDEKVSAFFGKAEYYPDHTFKMTNLDGEPKMRGLWSMSEDGKTRTLTAQDESGNTQFTRTVENVTVSDGEYTYRIYPDAGNMGEYIDIIHRPQ